MTSERQQSQAVFDAAARAWSQCSHWRNRRERLKLYTYGDQWNDKVAAPDGRVMTEGEFALTQGCRPMTNNLLRQLVRCVVGRFRASASKPTPALEEIHGRNQLAEIDARTLEEFLISGCAVQRIVSERRPTGSGVWVDMVSPARFFVNRFLDPRGLDIEICGMIHDMSLAEVRSRFAADNPTRAHELTRLYSSMAPASLLEAEGLWQGVAEGRCRVVEVWTLESRDLWIAHDTAKGTASLSSRPPRRRDNLKATRHTALGWICRWYAPDGTLLHAAPSTLPHGAHPFTVKFYPLVDGEVHSFIEDIIDQQRHINRLITQIDHIMSVSAKGALLFPYSARVRDGSWDDYRRQWSTPGAFIVYDDRQGNSKPEVLNSNPSDAGAAALLSLEMKLMEQISGVGGALRGLPTSDSYNSASLYQAQADNGLMALRDIFDSFQAFLDSRNRALLSFVG